MVSCLCPFRLQVKQGDRPFVSVAVAVAVAVAPAFVAPAVDVRVLAAAALEPAAPALVVPHVALVALVLLHARRVAVVVSRVARVVPPEAHWPGAQPASAARVVVAVAVAGVPALAAAAQRDVLHVVPDHDLSAQPAVARVAPEPVLAALALIVAVVHRVPVAHHAPGTSVPLHDRAHCSRASGSRGLAGTSVRPESCS
jgi:hypothetical protein